MGGRALKNLEIPTKRCNRVEFDKISGDVIEQLKLRFNKVGIPVFYKNKKDFGDIDIVVSEDSGTTNVSDYIQNTFEPMEIYRNGNVYSFDYFGVQIDVIITANNAYDTTLFYMGNNDMGNFIGRIAQGFGLKYGQQGLWYEHYFKGSNIARIDISKNYEDIFKFLGLSYERYLEGFDELEDIFEYIATCKFFNWKMFQMDKLNKINRDRNLKRKSYMSFLEWMDRNVADDEHLYQFDKTQDEYNKMIAEAFPYANLELEIRRVEYEYCKSLYVKSKFSGRTVMDTYGLEGKQLGEAMIGFKTFIENNSRKMSYDDFIIDNSIEDIHSTFNLYLSE